MSAAEIKGLPGLTAKLALGTRTRNGRARAAALSAASHATRHTTTFVDYHSAGELLIIGQGNDAIAAAEQLRGQLACTVLLDASDGAPRIEGVTVMFGKVARLEGHLGHFLVAVKLADGEANLAALTSRGREHFDIVLDLVSPAHVRRGMLPAGYFAPEGDAEVFDDALRQIPDLIGDFEKPRYFRYNPDICAHGRSGITACTRCIDACPANAISALSEAIEVDPYLCQGGGVCATACPSGAISFAFPVVSDLLETVRDVLHGYHDGGGVQACVLFHDTSQGGEVVARIAARMPEHVIPFAIEEIGSVGLDTWLSTLAYGAAQVILLGTAATPTSVSREITAQLSYAHALLEGMGYEPGRVALISDGDEALLAALDQLAERREFPPASFAPFDEKRTTIGLALEHLHAQAPAPRKMVSLPAGAPFGYVTVDTKRCTLCMACASTCPGGALLAGDDRPQLKFVEANCVQCGLCARSCPENAIAPSPRYLYNPVQRRKTRVLYEEQPFHCVSCGKPFATKKIMDRMQQKLRGHSMFQTPEALRRLQMCEDCRVRDLYAQEDGLDLTGPP